jgi:uncharacterized protein YndB with AHSA1/START domain
MSTQPIERQIHVKADPAEAFRIFTAEMTSWWPLDTFSMAENGQKTERVVVEERESGRIYEILSDGSECDWGRVTGWEPGRRLMLDWNPSTEDRPYTEIEVTFDPADDGGSLVSLSHRKWELLRPEVVEEARAGYGEGWVLVFDQLYGEAAGRSA